VLLLLELLLADVALVGCLLVVLLQLLRRTPSLKG
jgi:hypothetical protein